ncbi:ABC transporter ATP-binding protein [Cryptosporangium arvum]|uniref:ABC transporter ATP-binding protein n=1 Tax=Cryptosporangium arvum TaxID=80871 RepID=UPI0004AE71DC|nr:ABC transporter ATP-binding protein [Cryptosporangium arvum]
MSVLEAREVTKSFGAAEPVLRGISLHVEPGELVAIVGPSGSGKSTLLYCLAGLEAVTSGDVSILGTPLAGLSRRALAAFRRDHVGFVFQSYNLITSLTVRDNVALPARLARRPISSDDIAAAIERVGLSDRVRYKPAQLSGGQQQRVAIARVLAMRPDLVFADEPTGALDTAKGDAVLRLLREAATGDRAVVMVTHDLEAAARGDRVLVLRDGRLHAELHHPGPAEVLAAVGAASEAV